MSKNNNNELSEPLALSKFLTPISEFPSILDTKAETKRFLKFMDLVIENHIIMKPQDTQIIRERVKFNIPPLKKVEELRALYEKCFFIKKKLKICIFTFNIL